MSGHSKWATIKHKKAATDAKRGKIFSKLAREIMVAARQGGGDPATNITLRSLVQKAKSVNMPAENVERAIKKGTGELDAGQQYEEVIYEAFGPGGVGIIVQVLTDNRNRSAAEVRHVFSRHNISLGAQGSVARGFRRRGVIRVPADKVAEDRLLEIALEAGADDMERDDGQFVITTEPAAFQRVTEAIVAAGIPVEQSEVTLLPDLWVTVSDPAVAREIVKLVDALEDLDDVQNVYTNLDVDEAVLREVT
ncbi:MAG: YebC/PmpR family DNA-binding transcriptional regulator [Kiritimatiellae bacterium]|nr:YebC/PmpR family DNA-binding transcriptional regulator [Kiritimatiellia bacterium]